MATRTTHIKIRERKSLGVRRLVKVAEYKSLDEAQKCGLDGTVYPVIEARKMLRK